MQQSSSHRFKNILTYIFPPVFLVCAQLADRNISEISDVRSMVSLFIAFAVPFAILYLVLEPLFRRTKVSIEIVFMYFIVLFFSFSLITNSLSKNLEVFLRMSRISMTYKIVVIVMILAIYLSTKKSFRVFSRYLIFAACFSEIISVGLKLGATVSPIEIKSYGKTKRKPNVYFFVIDALPSKHVLKHFHNHGADPFINMIESNGFSVSDNMHSNYFFTLFCLSSQFMMEYHKDGIPVAHLRKMSCGTNNTVATFHDNGYKYVYFSCKSQPPMSYRAPETDIAIFDSGPIAKICGRSFLLLAEGMLKRSIVKEMSICKGHMFGLNYLEPSDVQDFLKSDTKDKPSFVFAHFMQYHDLAISKNGKRIHAGNMLAYVEHFRHFKYAAQSINHFGQKLSQLIDYIVKNDPDGIIIIQGDHGTLFLKNLKFMLNHNEMSPAINLRYKSFFAIRFGRDKKISDEIVKKTTSAINIFRNLFDQLGAIGIKPLENHGFAFGCGPNLTRYFTNIDHVIYNDTLDARYKEYLDHVISEEPFKTFVIPQSAPAKP